MCHAMKFLETVIFSFDNWSHPWAFFKFVVNNQSLTDKDVDLFKSIWLTATDSYNWKDSDLVIGCKVTQKKLSKLYELSDDAIAIIVRAASYEWK